jgi:hypothetical protein
VGVGDGRRGVCVLVAPRGTPKGASLLLKSADGEAVETWALEDVLEILTPEQAVDILCAQQRTFDTIGLVPPMSFPSKP